MMANQRQLTTASITAALMMCLMSCNTEDEDYVVLDSHVRYGDGGDCGEIGSAFWNLEERGLFVQAFTGVDVCDAYLGILDAVNEDIADYVTDSLEAEATMDGPGACDALLALHQELEIAGYYDILFPAGSCHFYAQFDDVTATPMRLEGAQVEAGHLYVTDSAVLPAIEAYLGDCSLIENWAQWADLYAGFLDQAYWPGEIYGAMTGDVTVTFDPGGRFILEAPEARMSSVLHVGVEADLDVLVDGGWCSW